MPLASTKAEFLESLHDAHEKLDAEYDDVTAAEARSGVVEAGVCPADLLAYQIGWGLLVLQWEDAEQAGNVPDMPARGYKWNELTPLAQSFYKRYAKRSLKWLRAELGRVVDDIAGFIAGLTEDEFLAKGHRTWAGEKWPVAKWVQINTVAPYKTARTKLRRWKRNRA